MRYGIRGARALSYEQFITGARAYSSPQLKVPNFQRNFVWGPKQIKKFIEAITESPSNFYIGNFVIQECGEGASGRNLVIDGQQRLVTISLMLAAMLALMQGMKAKKIRDALYIGSSVRVPRLSFTRVGMDSVYKKILTNKVDDYSISDKLLNNVVVRFRFVNKIIRKMDVQSRDALLGKTLNLRLVIINCRSAHDVMALYLGLNSTNKMLAPAELIKSLVVGGKLKPGNLWQKLEQEFAERNPSWLDKFFRHHWFSVGGYVSSDSLYEKVREFMKRSENYLDDLAESSAIYINLRDADFRSSEKPWKHMRAKDEIRYVLRSIRALHLDQVYAPLMALIKYGNRASYYLKETSFFDDLIRIWCFLLLFKFSNANPNKPEHVFANFCKAICASKISTPNFEKIRKRFFKSLLNITPSKRTFFKGLVGLTRYSAREEIGDRQFVESILALYLFDGLKIIPETCDIEHIFPEGSNLSEWQISARARKVLVDKQYRYTLGNLTLLKPADNNRAGSHGFRRKYESVYSKDRVYSKNKQLNQYHFATLDPQLAIRKRTYVIAESIYETLRLKLHI